MTENKKEILILGLGSDVLMDFGIGTVLMWHLEKTLSDARIKFETNLVGGMDIIELIRDYEKVIILDAIKTPEGITGTVYGFNKDNFKETLHLSVSHDITFQTALELAKKLSIKITDKLTIIAIEVEECYTLGDHFSHLVQAKYEEIKKEVETRINEFISSTSDIFEK
jgi:hydrogenase maturation protease